MLGRLLTPLVTPLVSRFDTSPRPESTFENNGEADDASAENFARDVRIEVMRNTVESLKGAETLKEKMEALGEIHRIMLEESCTKDVFRELDGYLLVVSVLSMLHPLVNSQNDEASQTEEPQRLVFMVLAESINDHPGNALFFEEHIGYSSLLDSLSPLLTNSKVYDQTFGFLLSASQNNFALSSIFATLRSKGSCDFSEFKSMLGMTKNPCYYSLLVALLAKLPSSESFLPKAIFALTETLISASHRNKTMLGKGRLLRTLLEDYLLRGTPVVKLLRKLVDVGMETRDARYLFQRSIREDGSLHPEVLEIIRSGMKFKWPTHFSMEGAASIQFKDQNVNGLPSSGFTFMIWLYVERYAHGASQTIFKVESSSRVFLGLSLRSDGTLELSSSESGETVVIEQARVSKARWTHLVFVHHPHRKSSPTIRIFIDGSLVATRHWAYPRADTTRQTIAYIVGSPGCGASPSMSWCFASSYLLSSPVADDVPRIIQHLGPRYTAHFQTKDLYRFLTYEASTSLNVLLSSLVSQRAVSTNPHKSAGGLSSSRSSTLRILLDGIGIAEESFLFSISASGYRCDDEGDTEKGQVAKYVKNGASISNPYLSQNCLNVAGDVVPVSFEGLDVSMWKVGGCGIALRLVELASNPHEMSRSLGIFADCAQACWQMSEDMERLMAFDTLAHILRLKAQLINLTAFETLFESLGLNFRKPDRSVIINTIAYRSIALDFGLWSCAKSEIQQMHLDHFATLLKASRHRAFNAKQRIAKFAVVRKMLFVLQTNWYAPGIIAHFIRSLKCVAQACFSSDDTIKPIVSFLAATLHEDGSQVSSPRSVLSQIDQTHVYNKAEEVLTAFVSILSSESHFARFSSVLPVPRICLLLLGDKPSAVIAVQVLTIIHIALKASTSFIRRFELVSGWTALKATLPDIWNGDVQRVVFDVMLGRVDGGGVSTDHRDIHVTCPNILPTVLAALERGLLIVAKDNLDEEGTIAESTVESLLELLMDLQSSSSSFRHLFKSQQMTAIVIGAYASFVAKGSFARCNRRIYVRILEKMNHFIMALTLDNAVNASQKHEMLRIFRIAEAVLTSDVDDSPTEDASRSQPSGELHAGHANVHMLSEKAYQKTATKIRDWRRSIIANERKRLRRIAMDLREYRQRAEQNKQWRNALYDDRGLWSIDSVLRSWILDETEGPCRVRKKLQRMFELPSSIMLGDQARIVVEPDDAQSFVQVDLVVPPWAEGYEFQPSQDQWIDEFSEDKLRRIRQELQDGDIVEAVCTVTRIVGVDSSPGLLLLGRSHLYVLDGLVENDDGEIVEASHAPRNLFTVPGSVLELDGAQKVQKWTYDQLASFSRKTCLFRDVALELYFKDNRSLLMVFPNKKCRQEICDKLTTFIAASNAPISRSPLVLHRSPLLARTVPKVMTSLRDELATAQRKWQVREISNFTYISILNQTSGRTPCDATQYPVFPWVLADYTSESLDLSSPTTFRDLTRPMGALSEDRRDAAHQRYENLRGVGETPFHYGTHFSSSMIVCHFLIRLEPFTHMFKTLQGGDWDLPDRLFVDVARAYFSASLDMRGDVRELIPEFFTCPEFLQNIANVDFGIQQNTGEKIHDVKLPPWAKGDPLLFITEHRKALESDFVSENLPAWIDLIWGYKQRDPESLNVYHPYSYEGAIDLDEISDDLEREATVGIIHNFGQTPRKLFNSPHPPRLMQGATSLPLGTSYGAIEDVHLLVQSARPVVETSESVASLVIDMISERVIPCPRGVVCVPSFPHEQLAWGFVDQSIKLLIDKKVVQVMEAVSCTCLTFADSDRFITGSSDYMLRFWDMKRKDGKTTAARTNVLRAHTGEVLCLAVSRPWSCVVSGAADGTAVIWDLNRAAYVRTIDHGDGAKVSLVSINHSTGYVASCSQRKLLLHTINARPIVELDLALSNPSNGRITSMTFHEREYSRLGMLATGTETGTIVLRTWTATDTALGERAQWKFVTLRKLRCREGYDGTRSKVTAVEFVGESLYHGDENGKVYAWELPD